MAIKRTQNSIGGDVVVTSGEKSEERSISKHPLLIAVITSSIAFAGVIVAVVYNRPPSIAELDEAKRKVIELQTEIDRLKRDNSQAKVSSAIEGMLSIPSRQTFTESFVIPNGKFMDAGDKAFFITVDEVTGSVAEISVKKTDDISGFEDRRFVTKGSSIRMTSKEVSCTLNVNDVGGAVVNVGTTCVKTTQIQP